MVGPPFCRRRGWQHKRNPKRSLDKRPFAARPVYTRWLKITLYPHRLLSHALPALGLPTYVVVCCWCRWRCWRRRCFADVFSGLRQPVGVRERNPRTLLVRATGAQLLARKRRERRPMLLSFVIGSHATLHVAEGGESITVQYMGAGVQGCIL